MNEDIDLIRHKPRPRLDLSAYQGFTCFHIILRTAHKRDIFVGDWNYHVFVDILKEVSEKHGFLVIVYCFMPNHLHLLLESDETGNLKEMMRVFKQMTSFHFKKATGNRLWQPSYYDRVLRKDEDTLIAAKYIAENPVRAKILQNASDYLFTGSFKYNKEEICGW